jgi:hypothetical protein
MYFRAEFTGYVRLPNHITSCIHFENELTILSPYKRGPRGGHLDISKKRQENSAKISPLYSKSFASCSDFHPQHSIPVILPYTIHPFTLYWHASCKDSILGIVQLNSM